MELQKLIIGEEYDFDLGGGIEIQRGKLLEINENKYTIQDIKEPEVRYIGNASINYHMEKTKEGKPIICFREWMINIKNNNNKEINTK